MDDAQPLRRPGEGDVEVVVPTHALGDDPGRVDDEHRVELQALRPGRRQDDGPGGEVAPTTPGSAAARASTPARRRRRRRACPPPPRTPPRPFGDGGGQVGLAPPAGPTAGRRSSAPIAAGGGGRRRPRRGPRRDVHDLGRRAVVDGQLLHPPVRAEVRGEHLGPAGRAGERAGLGDVADQRHRPGRAAAHQQPPGHRRELLRLVDDDVAVGPGAVGGGPLGRRPGVAHLLPRGQALGVEQVEGAELLGLLLGLRVLRAGAVQQVEGRLGVAPAALPVAPGGRRCAESSTPSSSSASSSSGTSAGRPRRTTRGRSSRSRSASDQPGVAAASRSREANRSRDQPLGGQPRPQPVDQRVHGGLGGDLAAERGEVARRRAGSPPPRTSAPSRSAYFCASRSITRRANAGRRLVVQPRGGPAAGAGAGGVGRGEPQRRPVDVELHRRVRAPPAGRRRRPRSRRPSRAGP